MICKYVFKVCKSEKAGYRHIKRSASKALSPHHNVKIKSTYYGGGAVFSNVAILLVLLYT